MGSCPSPPSCQRPSLGEESRTGDTATPTPPTTELTKVKTKGPQDGCPPRCPGLWPVEQHSHLVERGISTRPSPGENISGETSGRPATAPRGLLGEALNLATQGIWEARAHPGPPSRPLRLPSISAPGCGFRSSPCTGTANSGCPPLSTPKTHLPAAKAG